ncbi:3-hydroxybutyryl-CoA dehydrogenase [Clostridium gasigenes]|uniref:3-hydroxybutyryl-CoA dehydrogenase n=1 Tax=Clostridium gasigenes TaxID=94869 RepID=A0A7X0SFB6_9CLOT|nr:3-hydroxybutyryl-CoA dehydrogenase [Clostridium gasigenes]MBB6715313.1 3-hydroxybutyryl-CoA dehydrogenase [Clostridium gasigenes]MBU3104732.1 3-hydroxybutyryl-CoA dehydrogenase [Clostridium gasigenes]MBU3108522.1 3-hydroxybutyryl-CoA dehydrogenase [Clostridium gasigenes]NKF07862.1 3-hydroxybutyryl-CoA dehydrogenase [Clostridium gasigenes]QSW20372.1 3-hydroxybutyryl-CoA dehydrogenase [Clostridium gasigenes]
MEKIFVLGAGTMGAGIVQAFAQKGHEVIVRDIKEEFVERGIAGINKGLSRQVAKGKMTEEAKEEILSRISGTTDLNLAADCDLVVEAAVENMKIKREIFAELDLICKPETILASNTSSLSITEVASATKRADKVIGMHFFNPAPVMKLVEIIKGMATSQETFDTVKTLSIAIGKEPVEVAEAPGFVVNRILIPMINEATAILAEGIASVEDIDTAMKYGANHPMGPLALGDLIGLDVCLAIMDVLYSETGDTKYRATSLLRKYVRAGWLGRKSGRGFYDYSK